MKKLIAFLLVLALSLALTVTAFAEDEGIYIDDRITDMSEDTVCYSGETTITSRLYSSCTIYIPETIVFLDGRDTSIYVSNINLEPGYQIGIYATNIDESNAIRVWHDTLEDIYAECLVFSDWQQDYITQTNNALFCIKDTENNTNMRTCMLYINLGHGQAGYYSGVMQYEVRIEPYEAD